MNWSKNCAATDLETEELDEKESELVPLPKHVRDTRALISDIECCHHKAERWLSRSLAKTIRLQLYIQTAFCVAIEDKS